VELRRYLGIHLAYFPAVRRHLREIGLYLILAFVQRVHPTPLSSCQAGHMPGIKCFPIVWPFSQIPVVWFFEVGYLFLVSHIFQAPNLTQVHFCRKGWKRFRRTALLDNETKQTHSVNALEEASQLFQSYDDDAGCDLDATSVKISISWGSPYLIAFSVCSVQFKF